MNALKFESVKDNYETRLRITALSSLKGAWLPSVKIEGT